MTSGDGMPPPESAEKSLGDIVAEVSEKASLLVREEIELAKAEIQTKVTRLGKGAAVAAAAGLFVALASIYFLFALAFLLSEELEVKIWVGFAIVTGLLLVVGAVAGFLAYRFLKTGAPPTPELAIEEAKETRRALEEVRGT